MKLCSVCGTKKMGVLPAEVQALFARSLVLKQSLIVARVLRGTASKSARAQCVSMGVIEGSLARSSSPPVPPNSNVERRVLGKLEMIISMAAIGRSLLGICKLLLIIASEEFR